MHPADAGEDGGKSADDWEESGQHDGLGAVRLVENARAFQVIFMEEKRIVLFKNGWPDFFAERIADADAQNRGGECDGHHRREAQQPMGRQNAGGEKQAVPGKEKTEEQAGFDKDDGE